MLKMNTQLSPENSNSGIERVASMWIHLISFTSHLVFFTDHLFNNLLMKFICPEIYMYSNVRHVRQPQPTPTVVNLTGPQYG